MDGVRRRDRFRATALSGNVRECARRGAVEAINNANRRLRALKRARPGEQRAGFAWGAGYPGHIECSAEHQYWAALHVHTGGVANLPASGTKIAHRKERSATVVAPGSWPHLLGGPVKIASPLSTRSIARDRSTRLDPSRSYQCSPHTGRAALSVAGCDRGRVLDHLRQRVRALAPRAGGSARHAVRRGLRRGRADRGATCYAIASPRPGGYPAGALPLVSVLRGRRLPPTSASVRNDADAVQGLFRELARRERPAPGSATIRRHAVPTRAARGACPLGSVFVLARECPRIVRCLPRRDEGPPRRRRSLSTLRVSEHRSGVSTRSRSDGRVRTSRDVILARAGRNALCASRAAVRSRCPSVEITGRCSARREDALGTAPDVVPGGLRTTDLRFPRGPGGDCDAIRAIAAACATTLLASGLRRAFSLLRNLDIAVSYPSSSLRSVAIASSARRSTRTRVGALSD